MTLNLFAQCFSPHTWHGSFEYSISPMFIHTRMKQAGGRKMTGLPDSFT